MSVAGARAIGDFFGSVPQSGRLDEIRLVPTPLLVGCAAINDERLAEHTGEIKRVTASGFRGSAAASTRTSTRRSRTRGVGQGAVIGPDHLVGVQCGMISTSIGKYCGAPLQAAGRP
jgi:hypothetical protein